ncbi:MAG: hypothetical protein ACTHM1_01470 [Solirubrobacteraceae bacterium]
MSALDAPADGAHRRHGDAKDSLRRLRELLLAEGGLMASLVGPLAPEGDRFETGPAQLAASGPRADGRREDYELLVEAIYEGYLLHYRSPRVVRPPGEDLGVLAGDRLYALGLDRLVKLGDMQAVAELADVITLTALAQADGRHELSQALWRAGARAVGWGASPEHERAKALVRDGAPEALAALHAIVGS